MTYEILIDKHDGGHSIVVREDAKIVDCFIDPSKDAGFYPPNTFLEVIVERKIPNIGGYFVSLPNGNKGLLKSNASYRQGRSVKVLSKAFYQLDKPQLFTDKLKIVSKNFIVRFGEAGFSFSRKIPKNFDRTRLSLILKQLTEKYCDIFVVCRSCVTDSKEPQLKEELEGVIYHHQFIKTNLSRDKKYFNGLAKKTALEKFKGKNCIVMEEEGIFDRLGVWDQLQTIINKKVFFNKGSYLIHEETNAFSTIDVNSGNNFKATVKEINLNACEEISRLIKTLGYGGKILIDFLPCSKKLRAEIFDRISLSFANDTARVKIWGWTKSGIFELERERDRTPLRLLIQNN